MPPIDRIEIIDRIYEGFQTEKSNEFESLWSNEAESRVDGYLRVEIEIIPLEKVKKEISEL